MDEAGQVSFEYLLTILFGVILAFVAFLVASYINGLSIAAETRIYDASDNAVSSLMS